MRLKAIVATCVLGLSLTSAYAANFSFTGNFLHDNDVQRFALSVGAPSSVSLRSWSYAGGVNAEGNTIARGGFDPILALFTSAGGRIGQQDDAGCGLVAPDAVTRQCWDTFFTSLLAPGDYIATIMQYDNFSNGLLLSDGFRRDGDANFRNGFVDAFGNRRDSHWAFDVLNVATASQNGQVPGQVPEPATLTLLALGLLGLRLTRKKAA